MTPEPLIRSFRRRRLIEDRCAMVYNILTLIFVAVLMICASAFIIVICHNLLYGKSVWGI